MSYALIDTTDLTSLGNAVRTKTGGSSQLSVSDMATAISGLSTGGGALTSKEKVIYNVSNYKNHTLPISTWMGNDFSADKPFVLRMDWSSSSTSSEVNNAYKKGMIIEYDGSTFNKKRAFGFPSSKQNTAEDLYAISTITNNLAVDGTLVITTTENGSAIGYISNDVGRDYFVIVY